MVNLAILWHMHQPYYEDLATGEHILPWVRLHAIKDYWGMVALLDEFPGVRVTFNLVPSLVVQVQAFAEGRARDPHLETGLKPAGSLTPAEAAWMVANGFHAPYGRMIGPYPRYAALHAQREARQPFSVDDLRDLQVWHKLAWMDPDLLVTEARLMALVERGGGFSEGDKARLREVELDVLGRVVPAYRAAAARGQVELAASPFYHPILPLLCDSDVHLRAHPGAARPRVRFMRPGDAREQVTRALAFHETVFGHRPTGMWPSEGSVSDEALAVLAEAGVQWAATDEDILSRSLGVPLPRDAHGHAERADLLYRPYRVGSHGPVLLFRDHALSDRVGFQYQSWEGDRAARDFIERVREAGRRFTAHAGGGEEATVAVILDGENAWEHYPGGGRPFLRALYGGLQAAQDIRTVTMSQAAAGQAGSLPSVFPGSWINADFYIWMGHRDDHRAWDQVSAARALYDERHARVGPADAARALEELLIAEGSDWFWWYGDDHSSDHDREFDDVFRRHLRNAYRALGASAPVVLFVSNISTGPEATAVLHLGRGGLLAPVLDGQETSFLEWVGATPAPRSGPAGAMHEGAALTLVTGVRLGVGRSCLFVRLDGRLGPALAAEGLTLVVAQPGPEPSMLDVDPAWVVAGQVVELAIPLSAVGLVAGGRIDFGIRVRRPSGEVVELLPATGWWSVTTPEPGSSWAV